MRLLEVLREGLAGLGAAVLPVECAGCGAVDVGLCGACADLLAGPGFVAEQPPAPGCPPVAAVTGYDGRARAVLVGWKDHGRHDVSAVLRRATATSVATAAQHWVEPGADLLLVPAPSSRRAVRRRGEDVVAGLAREAARHLRRAGVPARAVAALRQRGRVRDQAGLGAHDRARNLAGAVSLRVPPGAVTGRGVVLVDDVVTTGSTLAEAARVLTAAGADVRGAAVVAATARLHPSGVSPVSITGVSD